MGTICINVPDNVNLKYEIENTEIIEKIVQIIKKAGKNQFSPTDKHGQPRLKQNPRLMGVKYYEDPTAPLDDADWPQSLR